jgi:hypothetical protein
MPTGYTAGILDGEIKTFQQFAKLCVRNFGATIHMRDEPMDKEYEPRTPSEYYVKQLQKARTKLSQANGLTDAELISNREKELLENRDYNLKTLEKIKEQREVLDKFLKEAKDYQPPTEDHVNFKNFLVQQLTETIKFDCSTSYHDNSLQEIAEELSNLSADAIRKSLREAAEKDMAYYEKEYKQEVENCNRSNKWVSEILASLTPSSKTHT